MFADNINPRENDVLCTCDFVITIYGFLNRPKIR